VVIAAGIAVALIPFVFFMQFLKDFFKKYKKVIVILFIQNILLAAGIGIFFYFKYYKPLYQDSYLFPKEKETFFYGMLRDKQEDIEDRDFGLHAQEVRKKMDCGQKVFFVDIREIEEFNVGHIPGALHMRHKDIIGTDEIRKLFGLNEETFEEGIFILYCHNGDRAFYTARHINKENVKYLISGAEGLYDSRILPYNGSPISDAAIFGGRYQLRFQMKAKAAKELMKKRKYLVIDMRRQQEFKMQHMEGSISFPINVLSTLEYNSVLESILGHKGKEFILVAQRYSELFYANLLILRLTKNYGFNEKNFHIVFCQFQELLQAQ